LQHRDNIRVMGLYRRADRRNRHQGQPVPEVG
jgi:hypothetical protein